MSDATSKEFWDERYRKGDTPWDYGAPPPELDEYLSALPPPRRILIPGCGSAHDLRAALRQGHEAIGIDLSHEAVKRASEQLPRESAPPIQGDFFEYPFREESFDLIYERTFLCALPPDMRKAYVERIHDLLKPRGILAGYFLYGEEPEPPPHPLAPGEEKELFPSRFACVESRKSRHPLPLFEGMEYWQIWKKQP